MLLKKMAVEPEKHKDTPYSQMADTREKTGA